MPRGRLVLRFSNRWLERLIGYYTYFIPCIYIYIWVTYIGCMALVSDLYIYVLSGQFVTVRGQEFIVHMTDRHHGPTLDYPLFLCKSFVWSSDGEAAEILAITLASNCINIVPDTRVLKQFEYLVEPRSVDGLQTICIITKRDNFSRALNFLYTPSPHQKQPIVSDHEYGCGLWLFSITL